VSFRWPVPFRLCTPFEDAVPALSSPNADRFFASGQTSGFPFPSSSSPYALRLLLPKRRLQAPKLPLLSLPSAPSTPSTPRPILREGVAGRPVIGLLDLLGRFWLFQKRALSPCLPDFYGEVVCYNCIGHGRGCIGHGSGCIGHGNNRIIDWLVASPSLHPAPPLLKAGPVGLSLGHNGRRRLPLLGQLGSVGPSACPLFCRDRPLRLPNLCRERPPGLPALRRAYPFGWGRRLQFVLRTQAHNGGR
jgi:hypothetical protein